MAVDQIKRLYESQPAKLDRARRWFGRGLALAEQVLVPHADDFDAQEWSRAKAQLPLRVDRVALQDATGPTALLQFKRDGVVATFEQTGGTALANARGPCLGQRKRSDVAASETNTHDPGGQIDRFKTGSGTGGRSRVPAHGRRGGDRGRERVVTSPRANKGEDGWREE